MHRVVPTEMKGNPSKFMCPECGNVVWRDWSYGGLRRVTIAKSQESRFVRANIRTVLDFVLNCPSSALVLVPA